MRAAAALEPRSVEHIVVGANIWAVTLVDRIATRPAPTTPAAPGDPFAVVVEPYASWVVEAPSDAPTARRTRPSQRTADVLPFALRKIRILNGAHTALVARTRGTPIAFVREAMDDPGVAAWLEELLLEEVVPALGDRIVDGEPVRARSCWSASATRSRTTGCATSRSATPRSWRSACCRPTRTTSPGSGGRRGCSGRCWPSEGLLP